MQNYGGCSFKAGTCTTKVLMSIPLVSDMLKTVDKCALLGTMICEAVIGEEEAKEHHRHSSSG